MPNLAMNGSSIENSTKRMIMTTVNHDIEIICDAVAVVTKADPMSKGRARADVDARRICYKICREMLNLTYIRIAKYFNNNHATVLHGLKHFDALFETDRDFRNSYNAVMQVITSVDFDTCIIDSNDVLVDYVNLRTDHVDITQKYEMLLRSLHIKVTEGISDLMAPLDVELLQSIRNDHSCSRDLRKSLGDILVLKIKNA